MFKPATAESQTARNRPEVTFSQLPDIAEQDSESETENTSRDETTEVHASPQLTAYEIIPGDDSENSESEQITVRNDAPENLLETDHDLQNETERDSDVPTGRESRVKRPPVQFGIDEFINKNK